MCRHNLTSPVMNRGGAVKGYDISDLRLFIVSSIADVNVCFTVCPPRERGRSSLAFPPLTAVFLLYYLQSLAAKLSKGQARPGRRIIFHCLESTDTPKDALMEIAGKPAGPQGASKLKADIAISRLTRSP